ncbi:hypothetical protein OG21DRAFT_1484755 [Imleria badia]|nr:hypothetical protein OG21DRAFT_1484755 [Imleria badia]
MYKLLDDLNLTALHVIHARDRNHDAQLRANEEPESDADESDPGDCDSDDDILQPIIISSPSPILPLIFLDSDILDSESESDSHDSDDMVTGDEPYHRLLDGIVALINEVEKPQQIRNLMCHSAMARSPPVQPRHSHTTALQAAQPISNMYSAVPPS